MRVLSLNPARLARYEKENCVAYYQKDWLKLLRASGSSWSGGVGDFPRRSESCSFILTLTTKLED